MVKPATELPANESEKRPPFGSLCLISENVLTRSGRAFREPSGTPVCS